MSQSSSSVKHGVSPLLLIVLGLACLAFWLLASLLQIQTSEAFILNGSAVALAPNWAILNQPIDFFRGQLAPSMAKAVVWGWGIELIYLVCIVGYEIAHESVKATNKRFAPWFQTGMFALIIFDGYTDFKYGSLGSGFWGQLAFAGITAFIVMFFAIVGMRLIEHGLGEWRN